ncbi:MAG TPA: DUF4412 domain-containing protein [Tepidisphaeraceae bacterium]|nr:DUF4412 domain-containing protein [Tepidisphaeraceae bacterium]
MRLTIVSTVIVLVAALNARADLTIKMDLNAVSNGQAHTAHMTTSIKGNKVCSQTAIDPPPNLPPAIAAQVSASMQETLIIDTQTGQSVMLFPARKMKMTRSTTLPSNAQASAPTFTATGKTDTIDGHSVAEYSAHEPNFLLSIWTAKDYPNADAIRADMKTMMASARTQQFPTMEQVPGVPLKIELKSSPNAMMQMDMSMVVSSISTDPVSDDLFTIPDDYQEMPQGGFGMPQQGGPGMTPPPPPPPGPQ